MYVEPLHNRKKAGNPQREAPVDTFVYYGGCDFEAISMTFRHAVNDKKYLTIHQSIYSRSQRAEAILNKISNIINKTHTGLISVLQGFQKCIA